jgi:transporter family-2 protein
VDRVLAIVATIAAGGLIALQPPVNSQLARHIGIIGSAFVSTALAALVLLVVYVAARGGVSELGSLSRVPWYELTGGVLGAALVVVTLITVRTLGAGVEVASVFAGTEEHT